MLQVMGPLHLHKLHFNDSLILKTESRITILFLPSHCKMHFWSAVFSWLYFVVIDLMQLSSILKRQIILSHLALTLQKNDESGYILNICSGGILQFSNQRTYPRWIIRIIVVYLFCVKYRMVWRPRQPELFRFQTSTSNINVDKRPLSQLHL